MSHNGKYENEPPDPEVEPRAIRRQYTTEYKLRILAEIEQASGQVEKGTILRREGLYSQLISKWRQQRNRGALLEQKREEQANLDAAEIAQLKRENQRLRQKLAQAELIIEVQKKVSQLLGLEEGDPDERSSSDKSRD
jgi:transposase-like protein